MEAQAKLWFSYKEKTCKSILRHDHFQNDKDRIQIRVYIINKERVTHFSESFPVKGKEILRTFQVPFWARLKN